MLNSALNDLRALVLLFSLALFIRWENSGAHDAALPAKYWGGFIVVGEETGDAGKDFIMGYI